VETRSKDDQAQRRVQNRDFFDRSARATYGEVHWQFVEEPPIFAILHPSGDSEDAAFYQGHNAMICVRFGTIRGHFPR
jgi:GMP synthase-like glutamine amidotransferase